MYKSIKKKFKILKEILKHKNKYIKNLFYIKYKIKISEKYKTKLKII